MDVSLDGDGEPVCMDFDHQGVRLGRVVSRAAWRCPSCRAEISDLHVARMQADLRSALAR